VARPDDLFAPSLQDVATVRPLDEGERPWRLGPQFYVGFFGGALAVAALAWVNARRLGASRDVERRIVVVGVVGVVASVVVSYVLFGQGASQGVHVAYRIVGVLAAGALYKLQQPADRVYAFRQPGDDDHYDSMWMPGIVATVGGGLLQLGIVLAGIALIDAVVG
jgi:hypothetical protein